VAEPTIRPLGPADHAAWAGLRHALWPEIGRAELGHELEELLRTPFAGFGAFDGTAMIGFAEVSERPWGDGCDTAPVAWLEGIFMAPTHRRQGIARRLVAAVEAWARARDLTELGSDAELDNLVSRIGHARWGFAETERVVRFRKVLA
jgi:aminoglycoside 6'-N-acetyltransferase I